MDRSIRNALIATILTLHCATAFAQPSFTYTQSDSRTYSVQGSNMDGVAGFDIDIAYDAASLAKPTVTQGGLVAGAIFVANTSPPGHPDHVEIAVVSARAFSGSGTIATISFASRTGNGGINSIVPSKIIDSKGSDFNDSTSNTSAVGTNLNPGVPVSQPSQPDSPSVQQSGTSVLTGSGTIPTTPIYPGTITLPTDLQQRTDSPPVAPTTAPIPIKEPAAEKNAEPTQPPGEPIADGKDKETPQHVVYKGILDRFKQHNGSKKLSTMVALFDKKGAQTFRQEPAILLSNGQSKAVLTVDLPTRIGSSPNIAVDGGKLVSFQQNEKVNGRWIVEVLPGTGAVKVIITIIAGAEEFEFPLTVAPPIKTTLSLDEHGWNRFLKELGTTKAPLHDLNNDGVRDYIDEFIFVANYLAGIKAPAAPALTSKRPAK